METLADKIKRDGALNELDAVGWAIRLAKRIEVLHARGITHGGIAPSAVRVDGVSRASHGVLADAQADAATVSFYSPERVTAGGRSASDDTWAVAATLYAALTGSEPFGGGDEKEIRQRILAATVAPLAVFDVGDDDLQRVLDEAFARDIQKRTAKISALREALETWHPDPTTRDLPPLQEDEDYDDDEATVMRPALLPLLITPASSKRSSRPSQPRVDYKGDAAKAVGARPEASSSDEIPSAPGTHPSGAGPANPARPAAGNSAQPSRPASVPRAVPASAPRAAPGAATARAALPRLLARKPGEAAAATPAQPSPLPSKTLVAPVIREAASQAAEVPTTVRSSIVKVHDDDDDEATVMREGLVGVVDARQKVEDTPHAGGSIGQAADSPPDTTDGESRTTQVSPVPSTQPAVASPAAATTGRSEATLLVPSDGPVDSKLGAADTWPAPPGSGASREVARVGDVLRTPPVAAAPAFAVAQPGAGAGPPSQASGEPFVKGAGAPPQLYVQPGPAGMGAPPSQAYGQPAAPSYGSHAYGQPTAVTFGAPPQSHSYPQPPAGIAPPSGSWSAPRQSVAPSPARLLPAILVALVVLLLAAFSAFALLRYRATGRVFGAAPPPRLAEVAGFRST